MSPPNQAPHAVALIFSFSRKNGGKTCREGERHYAHHNRKGSGCSHEYGIVTCSIVGCGGVAQHELANQSSKYLHVASNSQTSTNIDDLAGGNDLMF